MQQKVTGNLVLLCGKTHWEPDESAQKSCVLFISSLTALAINLIGEKTPSWSALVSPASKKVMMQGPTARAPATCSAQVATSERWGFRPEFLLSLFFYR